MGELRGACVFGQSGGPTSVINASAAGVIQEALKRRCITEVYGAAHGISGLLNEELYDMSKEDPCEIELLRSTPSSALGSVRYKLKSMEEDETDYARILDIFKKYDIRYFFYNGGNDSMDTCSKISKYMAMHNYECRVIGIPKTIDNDLYGTDHCPGYGSAAKYIATSTMEVYKDASVYDTGMITILEVMGRNAGWLTASTALASYMGCGPDLIYLPEVAFSIDKFLDEVYDIYKQTKKVIIVVSEGAKDEKGLYISELDVNTDTSAKDAFGHCQLGGAAHVLAILARKEISKKVRAIEFSLLQRCATHLSSLTDVNEAYLAGKMAVELAVHGCTDKMIGFEREGGLSDYKCNIKLVELEEAANVEKKIPLEWINAQRNGVTQEFIDYALPLIQGEPERVLKNGLPRFARLKKVPARIPQMI